MSQEYNEPRSTVISRNGLTLCCRWSEGGRLASKLENYAGRTATFEYRFDGAGHLVTVKRDGSSVERYEYNENGQRVEAWRENGWLDRTAGTLLYDTKGKLIRAGNTRFTYDKHGALSMRTDARGTTRYFYSDDTMPDRIVLPDNTKISYQYEASNPTGPARRYCNGALSIEYIWLDPTRLMACRNYELGLDYLFFYDDDGILDAIRLEAFQGKKLQAPLHINDRAGRYDDLKSYLSALGRRNRLAKFFREYPLPLDLYCGTDQVGTLVCLTDMKGAPIKIVRRDSFGVTISDSFPDLHMPIGFAGGLEDQATRLVRFGYRDYDPRVGRFTAPDPANDTRGDGDTYDYCVDDPVSRTDATGLWTQDVANIQTRGNDPELTLREAFLTGIGNVGPSAEAFVNDLLSVVRDPGGTISGVGNIVSGYGSQILGIEHDSRAYSDAVTRYFSERYKSYSSFKETLAKDPVGLAADMSTLFTGGGGALRGIAKGGSVASKILPGGKAAAGTKMVSEAIQNVGRGLGNIGSAIDPLSVPGKATGRVVELVGRESGKLEKFWSPIQKWTQKLATPVSRGKKVLEIGSIPHTTDPKRDTKANEQKK